MREIVILIPGTGSNMQAISRAERNEQWQVKIAAVISNLANASGLHRPTENSIPAIVVPRNTTQIARAFDAALQSRVDDFAPDLLELAGFMRVLTAYFVAKYAGRMLSIHPSLFSSFSGLATHKQAWAAVKKSMTQRCIS